MFGFKHFQQTVISTYRLIMMSVLSIIIFGVLCYLFLIVFYSVDKNWGVPVILAPSQEKVLAFQSQIVTLKTSLLKSKVELETAEQKYKILNAQANELQALVAKFDSAVRAEAGQLSQAEAGLDDVLQAKRINTLETEKTARQAKSLLASVDRELAAGVITKDQAISRRMAGQSMVSAATDSKISQISLQQQQWQAFHGSRTLDGDAATSLTALQSLTSEAQLKLMHAQVRVDAETARQSVEQLRATIAEGERVEETIKRSPYYQALTEPAYVAFVQYPNLRDATPGAPVYDCLFQVFLCVRVGTVTQVYDAEQYARHPIFKTDIKGKFVGIEFTRKKSGQSDVVFFGHKPLLF